MKQSLSLAAGMEIAYVVKDAHKWNVDPERDVSEFDAGYYKGLLDKAWKEAAFVFCTAKTKNKEIISPLTPIQMLNDNPCGL